MSVQYNCLTVNFWKAPTKSNKRTYYYHKYMVEHEKYK